MLVSCLCVCHNKPELIPEAIQSILDQTYPNWEAIVIDSGVLHDAGYYEQFGWRQDNRIKLVRSNETEATRQAKAMAPWCFNECFRRGLVTGDLVMYLCDDDILYPNAFATFVSYCRQHPDARAMYASQDIGVIYPNGCRVISGERRATEAGGKNCKGRAMDYKVDYLQFCHKTEVLELFPNDDYWPEGKETESHADGLFMERVGALVPILPIDVKVSQNRRTPDSMNVPSQSFADIERSLRQHGVLPPLFGAREVVDREQSVMIWAALDLCRQRLDELTAQNQALSEQNRALQARLGALRYRIADRLHNFCSRVPRVECWVQRLCRGCIQVFRRLVQSEPKNASAAAYELGVPMSINLPAQRSP